MKNKKILTSIVALLMVFGVFAYLAPANSVQADTPIVTGAGVDATVTTKGGTASVTYTYANVEGNDFGYIDTFYTWDTSLMEFDSISGTDFYIVEPQSDVANGKVKVALDIRNGVKTPTPTVTLNFKNCFTNSANGTVANVTSSFPDMGGYIEISVPYNGDKYYELQDGEAVVSDAKVTLSLPAVSVAVNPTSATVVRGTTQSFTATVLNATDTSVYWTVDGSDSSIDANGLLSVGANETANTLTVTATSKEDGTKLATATITVVDAPAVAISVAPTTANVEQGGSKTFTATVLNATDTSVTWTVSGQTSADTKIDANGVLTIGKDEAVDTKITVTATSKEDATKSATATAVVVAKGSVTDPTDPVKPTDPVDPTDPVEPTDPAKPTDPIKDGKSSTDAKDKGNTTSNPSTGDVTNVGMLMSLMGVALLGLGTVAYKRKKSK